MIYDGKELATADWIGPIALSPLDGTPAFWTALGHATEADGSYDFSPVVLVFGKKKSTKWQTADPILAPSFSPDGERVFSVGTKDEGWGIMSLDRKGGETKQMGGHIVEVWASPAGNELACTLLDGDPDAHEWHKFFVQRRSLSEKGPAPLALGKEYDGAGGFVWSPDGEHFAYKVITKGKLGVAVDGADDVKCEFDFVDELTLAPETSEVAYVAADGCELDVGQGWQVLAEMPVAKGGRWRVVRGTTASAEYDRTRMPTWSPDGSRLAFAAREDAKWRVVIGDESTEPADEIARIEWAEDGSCVWYGACRGRELVVQDARRLRSSPGGFATFPATVPRARCSHSRLEGHGSSIIRYVIQSSSGFAPSFR